MSHGPVLAFSFTCVALFGVQIFTRQIFKMLWSINVLYFEVSNMARTFPWNKEDAVSTQTRN